MQSSVEAEDHHAIDALQQFVERIDPIDRRHRVLRVFRSLIHLRELIFPLVSQRLALWVVIAADGIRGDDSHPLEDSLGMRLVEKFRVRDRPIVIDAENSDANQIRSLDTYGGEKSQDDQRCECDEVTDQVALLCKMVRRIQRQIWKCPTNERRRRTNAEPRIARSTTLRQALAG